MRRIRNVELAMPSESGHRDGLAYTLWLPDSRTGCLGGVVILHGAGSCKESHHDFARALIAAGFAAVAFDQRGHGESEKPMDGRVVPDISSMASLLRERLGPEAAIALRGSSMGGYLSIVTAARVGAAAVIAICPASAAMLRRGVTNEAFEFEAEIAAVDAFLAENDPETMLGRLEIPVLILHAEGDEAVPVEHSRELAAHLQHAESRLITVPGGHHRSIQHDEELQAVSLRFLRKALTAN